MIRTLLSNFRGGKSTHLCKVTTPHPLWKPNQIKRNRKPRVQRLQWHIQVHHLESQSLFAKRAEHCRTVAQGLIAFRPITPSISAKTCGSGGVFEFHRPMRPSKVLVGTNLSQMSFVANSCKLRWYSFGSLYHRKSCQDLTFFRSHQIFQIFQR